MKVETSQDIESAVTECFASDPALLQHWHIAAGKGLRGCVRRTLKDVKGFDPSFKFFEVFEHGELVAYWGTEFGSYINLIFVKPEYRNKDFLIRFWAEVQKSLTEIFYTAVYAKNAPAIGFYSRLGEQIQKIQHQGHEAVVFRFSKKEEFLCH